MTIHGVFMTAYGANDMVAGALIFVLAANICF